jgi:hypothetical protein
MSAASSSVVVRTEGLSAHPERTSATVKLKICQNLIAHLKKIMGLFNQCKGGNIFSQLRYALQVRIGKSGIMNYEN